LCGIFDRIPSLKILLAHSGGTIPFLAGRLDSCVAHDPKVATRLQKPPSEYLKNLYYDAVCYHAPALKCGLDLVGVDRFMFGTDHPFFPPLEADDNDDATWKSVDTNKKAIREACNSDLDMNAILRENAVCILNLK
jgi:aminocarboxymuconate-semialdehyde decarboxylase